MLRTPSISLVARVLQSSRTAQSPAFASVARGFATESSDTTTSTRPVRAPRRARARAVGEEEGVPPPPPFEDDIDAIGSIDFVNPKAAVVPTREPPASFLAKAQKAPTASYQRSSSPPSSSSYNSSYSSSSYNSSSSPSSSDGRNSHVFATLEDAPLPVTDGSIDWARSFQGIGLAAYSPEVAEILSQELEPDWIEIKPDGILYLPEIYYRRILNKAFGPGGWGLVPRSETVVSPKTVSREFGLVCHGRLVSIARGEQVYFDVEGVPTASEGCKSNAMMRCCKDLGVASELWDPRFIRQFKKSYCDEAFVEHITTKRKRKMWKRKDVNWEYPYRSASF